MPRRRASRRATSTPTSRASRGPTRRRRSSRCRPEACRRTASGSPWCRRAATRTCSARPVAGPRDGSVTGPSLADASVTERALADDAVSSRALAAADGGASGQDTARGSGVKIGPPPGRRGDGGQARGRRGRRPVRAHDREAAARRGCRSGTDRVAPACSPTTRSRRARWPRRRRAAPTRTRAPAPA